MQLTGKLKEKVEQAETKEEAKKILEDVGITLDDEELDQIAGGCMQVPEIPQTLPAPK